MIIDDLLILMMNSSGEIALLSMFFLQLSLTIFLIRLNLLRIDRRSVVAPDENKESEENHGSFSKNCKKYFLTSREIEILKLIRDGLPYKIIAAQLHISENTVGTHVKNMFTKVEVTNKMELVSRVVANK